MTPAVSEIAKVISSGIEYLTLLTKTSHVRKLRKAVDFAEENFLLDEKLKTANEAKERQEIYARKGYLFKKFFKYNQG